MTLIGLPVPSLVVLSVVGLSSWSFTHFLEDEKATTVPRSFAEAEYRFMATITCVLKWLKGLLISLGIHHPEAIPLYCDSQSTLHFANNPVFHERMKHIEVDCHFVRDAITDELITLSYVPTITQ